MQYVRSISGSVSKTWNSINPATLSGAVDVIVVGQEDGTLACSPFHVRFGKFQLLRPSEKKVEFTVNNVKQQYSMKLGEGGEAFFVFETSDSVPEALQTSPLVSPAVSPQAGPSEPPPSIELAEPEPLDLALENARKTDDAGESRPPAFGRRTQSDLGDPTPRSSSPEFQQRPVSGDWSALPAPPSITRSTTEDLLPTVREALKHNFDDFEKSQSQPPEHRRPSAVGLRERSPSPPPVSSSEAVHRAISLSKKLWSSNIPTQISEYGDLMLDMTGYQTSEEQALKAELIARRILAEELEGNYDIGALIGADEKGNVWIYSSEEAKDKADRKAGLSNLNPTAMRSSDAISDPGYHSSDEIQSDSETTKTHRRDSDSAVGMSTPPRSPEKGAAGNPNKNYAKTLRLTSEQLKALDLKPGANPVSFTVNKATCQAFMYYWQYDVPIVISDIDGTITKSDALGHVLNMIGRDWTHLGVAKLYTDIASNGYHILYLTSRSVGQADTTRGYLNGVVQDGYRLPKGPVIMSPDRTMAALRREVYLRKPEVFKMACLRDIMALFGGSRNSPFYAGFGNRFTDALSYRSVNIPSTRIFTINSNAEVSLDLLSLNKYKTGYVSMREIVDHYFPPVALRVREGGEEFTDFNYWREGTLELDDFSASESEDEDEMGNVGIYGEGSVRSEDEGTEGISNYGDGEDEGEDLEASYFSRGSMDESGVLEDSIMEGVEGDAYDEAALERSLLEEEDGTGEISVDGLGEDAAEQLEALDLASDVTPPRSRNGKASQRQAQGGHPHRAGVDKGEGSAMHVQTTP